MDHIEPASILALRGPKGDPGAGLAITGVLQSTGQLPPYAVDGDAYLIGGRLHVGIDGAWVDVGPVQGPKGDMGPRGMQGVPGNPGPSGTPGPGIRLSGVLGSSSELPPTGVSGDAWLINGHVWAWHETGWLDVGALQGPKGDTGPMGPAGPVGPVGPAGTTSWAGIPDKPATFPPVVHTHDDRYYTESETDAKLSSKADAAHTHGVVDLTATGTKSTATFLRGDNTWSTPPDTNTTYSALTQSQAENPASTAAGLATGQRLAQAITANVPKMINPMPTQGAALYSSLTHGLTGLTFTKTLLASSLYLVPIWLPNAISSARMAIQVDTAVAGASLRLGVYSPSFTLIKDAGTVSAAATGLQAVTYAAIAMPAGLLWLAVGTSAAGIPVQCVGSERFFLHDLSGTGYSCRVLSWTFGALAGSVSSSTNLDTTSPLVFLGTA